MNGTLRKIHVEIEGGKYTLSYRQGYYARDEGRPGASQDAQSRAIQQASSGGTDPLKPFMDFGLRQTEQILYKVRIVPAPPKTDAQPSDKNAIPEMKGAHDLYTVDFAVDLNDLHLPLDPADGLHKGTLNLCLIVYDRYGQIASRRDHLVALNIKPDIWKIFEGDGRPSPRGPRCAARPILAAHRSVRSGNAQGGNDGSAVQLGASARGI